jgi:hypothetical protein
MALRRGGARLGEEEGYDMEGVSFVDANILLIRLRSLFTWAALFGKLHRRLDSSRCQ